MVTQRGGPVGGINLSADPKDKQRNERSSETITFRDFGGVNLQSPREDIGDNEFYWLEELIPIGSGNLAYIKGPGTALTTVAGETGAPTFTFDFNMAGVDYVLAIWALTGNAWIGQPVAGSPWTKIASAKFTSGRTAAAQWSNLGILIVDPVAGYYDWNVTTASTLTNLSGQLYNIAVSPKNATQLESTTLPSLRVNDPTGTGGTIGASLSAVSITGGASGTGYQVGDSVVLNGGTLVSSPAAPAAQQGQPTELTVTTVNGTGGITGFSITNVGYYTVVPGTAGVASSTGGAGTGATFNINWEVGNPFIITPGSLYSAPVVQAFIGGVWVNYSMTILTSGTILGSAIAVYTGRAWIAIGRTVQVTDANSYSSMANSGTSFTINDEYLHNNITALAAANNYLYIFGDDSIDILSNVSVVNGVLQFSRINASSSVGTSQPSSIFPYLRTLAFANNAGFYILSGATPEKTSDKLDNLVSAIDFSSPVYGTQVMVNNILCAAFLFKFTDTFSSATSMTRYILAVLFKGKWWFTSQATSGGQINALVALPISGLFTAYGWSGNSLYKLMSTANINSWKLKTKLWDAQAPILDKSALNVGFGATFGGAASPGVSVYVDTEYTSVLSTLGTQLPTFNWTGLGGALFSWTGFTWYAALLGYQLAKGSANNGGGKYMGITAIGSNNVSQIRLLALEVERTRRW